MEKKNEKKRKPGGDKVLNGLMNTGRILESISMSLGKISLGIGVISLIVGYAADIKMRKNKRKIMEGNK